MATVPLSREELVPPPAPPELPGKRRRQVIIDEWLRMVWRKDWLPAPELDPDRLIAAACGPDRRSDLIDGCWRLRLDVLAAALQSEASLNGLGRTIAYGQLTMALKHRLRWQDLWRRHPEIAEYPIEAPILIVGQMRSGTTRVQRLLAQDPRLQFTRFFESWAPIPSSANSLVDDRPLRAWVGLQCAHLINPDFRHIHPTRTWEADEEMGLQNISIFGSAFEAQWRVPSFAAHIEAADPQPAYAEFKRLLQTLGWLRRHEAPRPWVLKLPQFAQDTEALLSVFPDARVVVVERDLGAVVTSSASLVRNQMAVQSDSVDPHWIGREWLRKTRLRQVRSAAALAASDVPRVTVDYEAVGTGWRDEVAKIYRMLDMPLTSTVEGRMASFLAAPRHRSLARHVYRPEEFGLAEFAVEHPLAARGAEHSGRRGV